MPSKHKRDDCELTEAVLLLAKEIHIHTKSLMTAIEQLSSNAEALTTATTALTDAVNAAVVSIGSPTANDAQLNAIAAIVKHNSEVVTAQTVALLAAIANESTPPVEPPVE